MSPVGDIQEIEGVSVRFGSVAIGRRGRFPTECSSHLTADRNGAKCWLNSRYAARVQGIPLTVDVTADIKLNGSIAASMVPEPSAWAMLCVGLAGIGLMWRRMRAT
jgi:hypothetical protein